MSKLEIFLIEQGRKWEQVGPNKVLGWGKKSKNDNRVDSFIWHLRVVEMTWPDLRMPLSQM